VDSLIITFALFSCIGCHRASEPKTSSDLKTVVAPGGAATAHFVGAVPTGESGEPQPPLEFGVESLYFTFPGDARHHTFKPEGTLYFSDWTFNVFSPDGSYTILVQDRFGPITVVATAELRRFLDGEAVSVERLSAPSGGTAARVIDHIRWLGPRELEFRATCCGTSEVVTKRIGDARAPQ
jgi:hypothetical protein